MLRISAPRAQLVDDRERVDLPQRGVPPLAVEDELDLAVVAGRQLIIGQVEGAKRVEIARLEDPGLAVEALAAQLDDLGRGEAQAAHMVELLAQLARIDLVG